MQKRKLTLAFVLAAGLTGCTLSAQDLATDITHAVASTKERVAAVQGYAVQVCGFLPAAGAVTAIFNSGYANAVTTVGQAICDAVTSVPLADGPGDHKPRVNGIVVTGKFVAKR